MDNGSARETVDGILGNPGLIGIDPQTRVDLTYEMTRELVAARDGRKAEDARRIAAALKVVYDHGSTDGAHHKAWVIDQMVRALTGDGYEAWIADFIDGGTDGLDVFTWDVGIAP